ncbi:hypothetical protein GJ496_005372 [Pomphorhynchus laevis]|nr:hypothetical protein GJ496_005372 [Pomphorhynchus laevis]
MLQPSFSFASCLSILNRSKCRTNYMKPSLFDTSFDQLSRQYSLMYLHKSMNEVLLLFKKDEYTYLCYDDICLQNLGFNTKLVKKASVVFGSYFDENIIFYNEIFGRPTDEEIITMKKLKRRQRIKRIKQSLQLYKLNTNKRRDQSICNSRLPRIQRTTESLQNQTLDPLDINCRKLTKIGFCKPHTTSLDNIDSDRNNNISGSFEDLFLNTITEELKLNGMKQLSTSRIVKKTSNVIVSHFSHRIKLFTDPKLYTTQVPDHIARSFSLFLA